MNTASELRDDRERRSQNRQTGRVIGPEEERAKQVKRLQYLGYLVMIERVPLPQKRRMPVLVYREASLAEQFQRKNIVYDPGEMRCLEKDLLLHNSESFSWIYGADIGMEMRDKSPLVAKQLLKDQGRRALDLFEGIGLFRELLFNAIEREVTAAGLSRDEQAVQKIFEGIKRVADVNAANAVNINGIVIDVRNIDPLVLKRGAELLNHCPDFPLVGIVNGLGKVKVPGLVKCKGRLRVQMACETDRAAVAGSAYCDIK